MADPTENHPGSSSNPPYGVASQEYYFPSVEESFDFSGMNLT